MPATLPRLIGINHVALEVGSIEEALGFYGKIFRFTLRGRGDGQAFIDMGDQFLALMETRTPHQDRGRHFGLAVDDRARVRELAQAAGATMVEGRSSISSIRGATASRSCPMPTSSSRKRRTCCAACGSMAKRATRRTRSSPTRTWRREPRRLCGVGWAKARMRRAQDRK